MQRSVYKLVYSAMFLGLCLVLPFLTGQIPAIGSMLSPMHIPVFLCGFVCGWPYGLAVGFVAPLLRYLLFQLPPIYPTGLAMAFELATYGAVSGLLYLKFPKRIPFLYVSLIISMLAGRLVWGVARYTFSTLSETSFTLTMFMDGAFLTALPGILCHLLLVPPLSLALQTVVQRENRP